MLSLIISIFVLILIFSVLFSLVGVFLNLFFKLLGVFIVGGIIFWIINFISGGRFFDCLNSHHNYRRYRRNSDWYVINKRNRKKNTRQDHDEWSNF